MSLCRVLRRKLGQDVIDLIDALVSQNLIDVAQTALLDGQQPSLLVLEIADIMNERHQQIQLRAAPEVVRLPGTGSVLNDRVGHRLHQFRFRVQRVQTVPAVRVSHVQEIDGFDVKAHLFEVG